MKSQKYHLNAPTVVVQTLGFADDQCCWLVIASLLFNHHRTTSFCRSTQERLFSLVCLCEAGFLPGECFSKYVLLLSFLIFIECLNWVGTVVSFLYNWCNLVLLTMGYGRFYYFPFTHWETDAQRGKFTCPGSLSLWVVRKGLYTLVLIAELLIQLYSLLFKTRATHDWL